MRQITITAPQGYSEFSSLTTGILISLAVGVAAGLATADDVGRREMIGLAATAQIAIIPAWFGLCLVLGFPVADGTAPLRRACTKLGGETDGQRSWLQTRIKQAAPQALLVDI